MSRGGGGHTVLELCVTSGKMFVLESVTAVLYAALGTVILEDNLLVTHVAVNNAGRAAARACPVDDAERNFEGRLWWDKNHHRGNVDSRQPTWPVSLFILYLT